MASAVVLVVLWRTNRPWASADGDRVAAAGMVIADPLRSGGVAPSMVVIPNGALRVSEANADSRAAWMTRFTAGLPRRIAVARTETTVASFRRFVQATGVRIEKGCWHHTRGQEWKLAEKATWSAPGFTQTEDHPVACMAFEDAQAYVAWLSAETGAHYRLPTENELEYFNRAGHQGRFLLRLRAAPRADARGSREDRSADGGIRGRRPQVRA